jgi:2-oxoglutarate dehydrogenase E2 component (dihydrolipoamide succinyltransferase)
MAVELKVPEVGESITEVLIGDWLKSEGDHVDRDEEVVVIETDKATLEVAAPESGTLTKVLKRTGDKAAVGDIIGYLEAGATATRKPMEASATTAEPTVTQQTSAEQGKANPPAGVVQQGRNQEPQKSQATSRKPAEQHETEAVQESRAESETITSNSFLSSNGESEAEENRTSTGAHDLVGETNGEEHSGASGPPAAPEPRGEASNRAYPRPIATGRTETAAPQPRPRPGTREEKIVPMTPIRRRIAERLVQAQQTTAFLTTFNEIDMSAVKLQREENHALFQQKYQIKLGFMSFFVKASIEALRLIPQVNAEIRGNDLVFRDYYDIGVAVGGGKGLIVPVLRNAESMTFADIERAIGDFAARAEKNRIKPDELEGGTFTISNGGIYGSLLSTPILNPPQSGILGLHAIQDRPVVRNGQVVVRPMMYVALTYDHRIVDGREAVTFLKRIKECIEAPVRLLLEV